MTKFNGDTADEFLEAAHKKYGGTGAGETTYTPPKVKTVFKDGKLSKVDFDPPKIDMDYAEAGVGKPDDNNKAAIKKIADMAEEHEKNHKASYEATFKTWSQKAEKDLTSKSYKDAKEAQKAIQDALDDFKKQMYDACVELHKKEGKIVAKTNKDGTVDVSMAPSGPAGCK
ncbi:MAG TPA: hypothetical protein VJY39_18280 [Acidisphaera sp.]|nr:hypothetical protein [Acidisphaera sp.]